MINWAPTTAQEVIQNVRTLLKTEPGSVPLSRAMGTPQDLVDAPQSEAGAKIQAQVIRALRTYEPRAFAKSFSIKTSADGQLDITLTVGGIK